MKLQNKKNIDKLINKVLNETLESKAETLETKLKKGLEEDLGGMEDTHPTFGEFTPEDMEKFVKKHMGKKHSKYEVDEPNVNDDESEEDWNMGDIFESKEECSECGGMVYEGECSECGWKSEMNENEVGEFPKYQEFDYVAEEDENMMDKLIKVCQEEGEDSVACKKHKEYAGIEELDEELHGNQHKLDVAEPKGILNKKDFEKLGNMKKSGKKSTDEGFDSEEIKMMNDDQDYNDEEFYPIFKWNKKDKGDKEDFEVEVEEGNAFTEKLKQTPKGGKFKLGNKTYTDTSDLEEKECMECGGSKYPIMEKWEGDVEVEKTGEHSNKSIDQINSEIKKLKQQSETYKEKGKKVPSGIKEKMSELYFAKRAKQGWKGKGKAKVKESISLTESELIELIENIVMEEKNKKVEKNIKTPSASVPGLKKYKQAFDASGKENEDYLKSVTKKMKDYLKDGSKGEYSMEPKTFPMGNGQIEKMNKKAYVPSDAVQDYTDNLTAAGLENLDYDEIHPNEDWVSKNIEGSSQTGNNPEWANAVETGVNKKRNKIRKDNMLAKIKRKAYNKAPQPIVSDKAGEDSGSKLMMKLESKKQQQLMEEIQKINNLTSYNKNTQ